MIKEFHTLVNQQDAKIEDIKMTATQYDQLFKVMDESKSGFINPKEIPAVLKAYETWLYEKEYKKTMEELYSQTTVKEENNANSTLRNNWKAMLMLMSGPKYELTMNIVTIVNVFSIFARSLQSTANYNTIHIWMIAQVALNTFFLLEMITDWIVAGFLNAYIYHFRTWIETLCQILSIPSLIFFFQGNMNPDVNNADFNY